MHHALFKIHEAVVYIHQKGLLHRDLNPSNVFFSREGGSVKVGDFGLVSGVNVDDDTTRKQVLKYSSNMFARHNNWWNTLYRA